MNAYEQRQASVSCPTSGPNHIPYYMLRVSDNNVASRHVTNTIHPRSKSYILTKNHDTNVVNH